MSHRPKFQETHFSTCQKRVDLQGVFYIFKKYFLKRRIWASRTHQYMEMKIREEIRRTRQEDLIFFSLSLLALCLRSSSFLRVDTLIHWLSPMTDGYPRPMDAKDRHTTNVTTTTQLDPFMHSSASGITLQK